MLRAGREHKSAGQSLVELAMVLPLAVLILFLAADFGRALTAYIQLGSAAREGAAYGMQSAVDSEDTFGMTEAVRAETTSIWGEPVAVSFPECEDDFKRPDGVTEYDCVAVKVTYNFRPLITIWPVPGNIPMERVVEMRVIN